MSVVKLPLSTTKLINSSQVISSVSSVVKELMENSIDAGAKNIEIKLEKHGFEKIEVRDDGCGINCSDIQHVCLRSYTSKITCLSDLENLCCYGFRGEALSSLCAVSQVNIITKTIEDDVAMCYLFSSSGQVISSKPSHLPKGTTVCAAELFKGLPVRKQLMSVSQRASEELKKLENVVKLIAVVHPELRVTITHNKFLVWQKTSVSNLRQSMTQVFTQSVVTKLHQIRYSDELMKLEMMIPKRDCDAPSLCFSSLSDALCVFINKRIVVDKKIYKVVLDELTQYFGYYLPTNKYPMCIIILTVPANTLDVNLEPNKSKVVLQHMDKILETVKVQLRLYYYEPLMTPKINEEEQYSDIKTNKKRKAESSQSAETFAASSDNVSIKLLECNECKDYVEDAGKMKKKQDEKNVLQAAVNDEIFSDVYINEKKEDNYTSQAMEIEDSKLNVMIVPEKNSINSNSNMGLTSKEERSISTGNCVAGAVYLESCDYKICTVNDDMVNDTIVTLNDTLSSTSKDQTVLYEHCGHGIRYVGNVQIDKFAAKINQKIANKNCTKSSIETVAYNDSNKKSVNSENLSLVSEYICNNAKNVVIGSEINDGHYVKTIEVLSNKEMGKDIHTPTISQWSRGEADSIGSLQMEIWKNGDILEDQVNCVDGHLAECATNNKVKNQLTKVEMLSFTDSSSKLKSNVLGEECNQEFCLEDHMVENDKNQAPIANIDREKKILQKHNEKIVTEKKSIEIEVDFSEFTPFTNSYLYEADMYTVIGQLEASPLWLYRRNSELGVTSIVRLYEAVQFQKNLESMSIPIKILESDISFTERDLGSALWNVLRSLEKRGQCVADERITKNGFVIEISERDNATMLLQSTIM